MMSMLHSVIHDDNGGMTRAKQIQPLILLVIFLLDFSTNSASVDSIIQFQPIVSIAC